MHFKSMNYFGFIGPKHETWFYFIYDICGSGSLTMANSNTAAVTNRDSTTIATT